MDTGFIENYKLNVENRLQMLLAGKGREYDRVLEAASYSVFGGGKRIRPVLLLEFYKICGGNDDCAYNFACALEMIHTYSLIHDDLPCMDNDDFRRGRPSCHKQYGEALALLAGDGLLTDAFNVAARTNGIPFDRVCRGIEILSACAGMSGMVGGQVIDTVCENAATDLDALLYMYELKTANLLKAAATIGATLAGADEELVSAAEDYAYNTGIAFQIIDDILDATGDFATLGKPIGSDEKNGKVTAVTLLGIEKSRRYAKELTEKAIGALEVFPGDTENLKALTEMLLVRDY